jgi:peptide/nickel transport system substrate-binding protein
MRQLVRRGFGLAIVLTVTLAACAPAAPPAATPAPAAKGPAGKITVASVDFNTLDPHFISATAEFGLMKAIDEGLVGRSPQGEWVPMLAESWKQIDDKTWEFKLRKGVKFHDGEPFNAEAVKFNIDRLSTPDVKGRAQFPTSVGLDRVDVVDDSTIRILTTRYAATLLLELYNLGFGSPKWFKDGSLADIAKKPVGAGPYKFVEWVKDEHLTMEAYDGYWGTKPAFKTVVFRSIPEVSARIAELETGGIDIANSIPPDQLGRIGAMPNADVRKIQTGRRVFVGMRSDQAPFTDVRVRQAMNYAVNWDAIKTNLLANTGERLASYVAPPNVNPALKSYTYDVEKAKSLLAEAGLSGGFSTTLAYNEGGVIAGKEIAQAIAGDFAKVGVKADVQTIESSLFSKKLFVDKDPPPMYLLGLASAFDDQSDLTNLSPTFPLNPSKWNNQEWISLYTQFIMTSDPTQRKQMSYKLQEILRDDAPYVFLWLQYHWYGANKKIDWTPRPSDYFYFNEMTVRP